VDDEVLGGLVRLGISGTGLKALGAFDICAKQNAGASMNNRPGHHDFRAFIGRDLPLTARETQARLKTDQRLEDDNRSDPNLVVDEIEGVDVTSVLAVYIIGAYTCPNGEGGTRVVEDHDIKARLNNPVVIVPRRIYTIKSAEIIVMLVAARDPDEKSLEQTLAYTGNDVRECKILSGQNRRDRITPVTA
jgi:hypothetical protein